MSMKAPLLKNAVTALGGLAWLLVIYSGQLARSDDFTFASHFLNPPERDGGPEIKAWAAKYRLKPYYEDYTRCDTPDNKLLLATIDVSQAIDGLNTDFFFLFLFIPPYENSGTKDSFERWESRRAELIQIVTDASPVVTESFRAVTKGNLFDWPSLKCEDYIGKLQEHRNAIIAFQAVFKPFRDRIKAVRAKYKQE
jgi:hypothetical protein